MRHNRRTRVFPWLLLAGVAGGALLVLNRDGARESRRGIQDATLDDGSTWVLWHLSLGTNHQFLLGRWPALDSWRQTSPWLQRVVGPPTVRAVAHPEPDSLCLFYSRELADGVWDSDPPWVTGVIDGHGCVLDAMQSRGHSTLRDIPVVHQALTTFPRRDGEFGVQITTISRQAGVTKDTMRIHNPSPWRGAEWTPEPEPVTREVEGLRIVWKGFQGAGRTVWPEFWVEQDGVERPEWQVADLWFRDVTGNRSYSPDLCRHEPAWQVQARFGRKPQAVVDADEFWDVTELEAPGEAEWMETSHERVLQGVTVAIRGILGPGDYAMEMRDGWRVVGVTHLPAGSAGMASVSTHVVGPKGAQSARVRQSRMWVAIELRNLQSDHQWKIALVDEAGGWHLNQGWSGLGGSWFICPMGAEPVPGRLRLRFILQKLRTVEMTVAPPPLIQSSW